MNPIYDVLVIGAGVVGCSVARELSRYQLSVCVAEKGPDVCMETSSRNSAVLHAGYNNKTGSLMAKFCVEGNRTFDQIAEELDIPYRRTGKLVVGFTPEDREKLLSLCGYTEDDVRAGKLGDLNKRLKAYGETRAAEACGVGVPTLRDVVSELLKPGRDPRDDAPEPVFSRAALSIDDLQPGMELMGTVRNVVDFGAFVDVGVHQDGLVHVSKMARRFVKHPSDVVSVGDTVKVWVERVDRDRGKISLTMVEGK